ncbi:acetylornithine deacetylase or succinyl-diaminopimelate desuccinylase [Alkaliphilus metalliredigens QYMF]|uniref:Probable succinyl-diaminopimelate desuccinylase n=1 Tax=Alkaliphilus metalliredigens (strain QYMF) TaxID=293826 RepID=A6TJB4_ALKMQ|nr:M20 family metallopeptidase [Alkaliphilus metalliredigens]ABR46282.1 acetylornithine deacetylase or succinyl-diaminopimelate desuccinylase [Alkaliphilus metalliredigens QYMF]
MKNLVDWKGFIHQYYDEEELVKLTQDLIKIPSHVNYPGREKEVGIFLSDYCQRQGFDVEVKTIVDERVNVIVTLKGTGEGKTLLLNGHLDTVPPGEMDFDPYGAEIVDGHILGRGTVDMKGPIASMIIMMLALKRSDLKLTGDIIFTGVIGEEEQSEGTEDLVKNGIKADGAIVGEPSSSQYSAGHRGLEWLEIKIKGRSAHGGVPHLGINAIEKAGKLISAIQDTIYPKLEKRSHPLMGPSVMNFGYIKGGIQPSTVAGDCIIQIDRRYIPGETVATVIAEYQEVIDHLKAHDSDFDAEIIRMPNNMLTLDHLPLETSLDDPITVALKNALSAVLEREPVLSTKRGWTDASLLYNFANIPTIVYGPGDISYSHTKNEQIAIKELIEAVEVYFLTALQFCGN